MLKCTAAALLIGLLATSLVACGANRPPTTTASAFTKGHCLFVPGAGVTEGTTLTCGTLSVPEDPSHPSTSRQLHLAVAIFAAPQPSTAGDPVVYLGGGPGADVIKALGHGTVPAWILQEFGNRELIYFDQRGTGFSDPALRCPELLPAVLAALGPGVSVQDAQRDQQQAE